MVCGPGRAGKSSLIDSLKNKPISKKKDSTPGVSLSKATCHITEEDGRCDWPKETDDLTHQQLFLTESLSSASYSTSKVSTGSGYGQPEGDLDISSPQERRTLSKYDRRDIQQSSPRPRAVARDRKGTDTPPKHKALRECAKQVDMVRRLGMDRENNPTGRKIHFVDIWDFGGQVAYGFLQVMLLSDSRGQHLITFNGSIPMDAIAPPETFSIDGVEHPLHNLQGQQTYGEVVIGWLDAIYQIVGKGGTVRLVGTHLDKVSWAIEVSYFQSML